MTATELIRCCWSAQELAIRLGKSARSGRTISAITIVAVFCAALFSVAKASSSQDQRSLLDLDTQYQQGVKNNDAATMDRLLADSFVLVTGSGKTYTKNDLLKEARSGHIRYEHQEDFDQTVRIWDDTAVITARLWESGTDEGKPFDYMVWFSDIYFRTPNGWRYYFGQSSLPMPADSSRR